MRRIRLSCGLVGAAMFIAAVTAQAQSRPGTRVAMTTNATPVFLVPDEHREPLATLVKNRMLTVVAVDGDWVTVQWTEPLLGQRTGYVRAGNVVVVDPAASAAPKPSSPSGEAPRTPAATPASATAVSPTSAAPTAVATATKTPAAAAPIAAVASAPPTPTAAVASASAPTAAAVTPKSLFPITPDLRASDEPDAPASAWAQQFDERQTADAIRRGTRLKGGLAGLSLIDSGQAFSNALAAASGPTVNPSGRTGFSLRVYTPLSWIEQLASNAAKEYRPFTPAHVTDEMMEPVLRVIVYPDKPTYLNGASFSIASSVQHVVLRDEAKRLVVQPLSKEPFADVASSALRDMAYQGLQAKFPIGEVSSLRSATNDGEFLIVVVGEQRERIFKVKKKHFDSLR